MDRRGGYLDSGRLLIDRLHHHATTENTVRAEAGAARNPFFHNRLGSQTDSGLLRCPHPNAEVSSLDRHKTQIAFIAAHPMTNHAKIIHHCASSTLQQELLGSYVLETLIEEPDEIHMTAYRVTVPPHSTTAIGYHLDAEEIYYVLTGHGTAVLNQEEFALQAGDFFRLPPGTEHGFITGEESLVMLDIHSPGSRPNRDIFFTGDPPDGFSTHRQSS